MKSAHETFIIHDVGAANFIPSHLVIEDAIFYHFDPDLRGIQKLEEFYKLSNTYYEISYIISGISLLIVYFFYFKQLMIIYCLINNY